MSSSNFEMVMVGETEEGRELKLEAGFPLPPQVFTEETDDLPLLELQDEELNIKDEPLDDVDEPVDAVSDVWSMSPCTSFHEQAAGVVTSTEPVVSLEDPFQEDPRSNSKSVNKVRTHHLKKTPQRDKLKIVRLPNVTQQAARMRRTKNSTPKRRAGKQPLESVHNGRSLVNVNDLVTVTSDVTQMRASHSNSDELLSRVPTHITTLKNGARNKGNYVTKFLNSRPRIINVNQPEHTQQNCVSHSIQSHVNKCRNLSTITGNNSNEKERINSKSVSINYHCNKCNTNYDSAQLLMNHNCTDFKCKFYCKMCPKVFYGSRNLQNHIEKKHSNIVDKKLEVAPVICLRRVEEWYNGKIYSPKPNLTCAVCKYVTTSKKSLKLHIKSHFKIKYFKCKFCEARFLIRFQLKMHCKKNHGTQVSQHKKKIVSKKNTENKLCCKKCNIKFKTNLALHIHIKSHSDSYKTKPNFDHGKIVKKKYTCKICNKSLRSRSKIDSHIITVHRKHIIAQNRIQNTNMNSDSESEDDSSLACKECDFKCTSKSELQNHVNFHLIFKFKCKHCGIFLMNESELDKHLKISHKSEENATLELSVHTEDNVATTNEVDNATSTNSRQDENITQYPCKYCGKIYVYSSTVEYHQKTQHKEECDAERNPRKLTRGRNLKIKTHKGKTIKRCKMQNLTARKDKNLEGINIESDSKYTPDVLNDDSNQEYSSGAENDDFQFEEDTEEVTVENAETCTTKEERDILQGEESNVDTPNQPLSLNSDSTRNYLITCNLCNKVYPTFSKLYIHGEKHHEIVDKNLLSRRTSGSIKCKVCSAKFNVQSAFQHHMLRHRGILPYQCKFCGKIIGHIPNVILHHKTCYKNENNDVNFMMKDSTEVENDLKSGKILNKNTSPDLPFSCNQVYTCDICKIYFLSFRNIYEHAQIVHSNNFVKLNKKIGKGWMYKCDECRDSFSKLHFLRQHKIRHRGIKAFPCMFCTNIYSSQTCAYHHCVQFHNPLWKLNLQNKSTNVEPSDYMFEGSDYVSLTEIDSETCMVFTCHKCDIIFKTRSEIYQHCKNIHNDIKNRNKFSCVFCNKIFRTELQLKSHRRTHRMEANKSGNDSFCCGNCGQEFVRFETLKRHIVSSFCKNDAPPDTVEKTGLVESMEANNSEGQREMENYETNPRKKSTKKHHRTQKIKHADADNEDDEIDEQLSEFDASKDDDNSSESGKSCENKKYQSENKQSFMTNSSVSSEKIYICNLCNQSLSSINDVFKHGEKYHEVIFTEIPQRKPNKGGPYKCKICSFGYGTLHSLNYHMLLHRDIKPFPCKYCDKRFPKYGSLKYHYRINHYEEENSKDEKQHNGNTNQKNSIKSFASGKKVEAEKTNCVELVNKSQVDDEIDEELSDDDLNEEVFNSESESNEINSENNKFQNTKHKRLYYYACNLCNQKLPSLVDVYKHGEKHEFTMIEIPNQKKINTGPYKCDQCDNSYASQRGILQHTLLHRNIKPYVCVYCSAAYSNYCSILHHCTRKHLVGNQKSMARMKNTEKFISENKYNNYYVNTFSKTYSCNLCKIYYSDSKYLIKHVQKQHGDIFIKLPNDSRLEGPYKCDECDQSFDAAVKLECHKLKHRNIIPLPCSFCAKAYHDNKGLYYHYKRCHILEWKIHKMKRSLKVKSKSLNIVYRTFMFEGSKYITLTEFSKKRLSFECHDCKLVFKTKDEVQNHCKIKHSRIKNETDAENMSSFRQLSREQHNKNLCKYCGETFSSWKVLDAHCWNKHESQRFKKEGEKEFYCEICDKKFDSSSNLTRHLQILHGLDIKLFYCGDCDGEFTNFDVLKKHITSSACKNESLEIETIGVGVLTRQKRKNEEECKNSKKFKASEVFENTPDVEKVMIENYVSDVTTQETVPTTTSQKDDREITVVAEDVFSCYDCNASFDTKLKLKTHIKRHIKYYYNRNEKIMKKRDPKILKLTCKICNKTFKTKCRLKTHLCINQIKLYTCTVCKEKFESKHLYVLHKLSHEKSFVCKTCGDGFVTELKLKVHTARKHEEHKFLCYRCGSKFPFQGTLNTHLKRHENIEYQCKGCDQKFFTFKQRQQHYNLVHGAVTFFCKFCSVSFSRKDHLNEHERIHEKTNRTFTCQFCNKIFYSSTGIKFHILKLHNDS